MSSPKVASSELKTGVLKIPAHGETLSASALEEALALELKDCVWEIVGRKTYPDGVELSYKAISRASWEKYRNLPAKERPLTPQAEKTAAAKKIKTAVENLLLVGGSFVFLLLIFSAGSLYFSNTTYLKRLEKMLSDRAVVKTSTLPQKKWVGLLNQMGGRLAEVGVEIEAFEISATGGWLTLKTFTAEKAATVSQIVTTALSGKYVSSTMGGQKWQWRE